MEAKGPPLKVFSCPSETPLTLAAQTEGSVEVIRTLCLGGAHIDFRARDGMTALHKAACARHCLALTVRLPWFPGHGGPFSSPFYFFNPTLFISVQKKPPDTDTCHPSTQKFKTGLGYVTSYLTAPQPK